MIFVSCGTEKYPFHRLVAGISDAIERGLIKDRVVIQGSMLGRKPDTCEFVGVLAFDVFIDLVKSSDIYVCHGGAGSLIAGLSSGKRPVAVPRYKKLQENVDDHQVELTLRLAREGLVIPCLEGDDLAAKIGEARTTGMIEYSPPERATLLKYLRELLLS